MAESRSFSKRLISSIVYTITVPKGTPWQPELAHSLMLRLLAIGSNMVFQIVAEQDGIRWQVHELRAEPVDVHLVPDAVHAIFPEAVIQWTPYTAPPFVERFFRRLCFFKHNQVFFVAPIKYPEELKTYDPLVSLANLMSSMQAGERVVYVVNVSKQNLEAVREGESLIYRSDRTLFVQDTIQTTIARITKSKTPSPPLSREKYEAEIQKILAEKINAPLYDTYVMVQVDVSSPERVAQLDVTVPLWEFHGTMQVLTWLEGDQALALEGWIEDQETAQETSAIGMLGQWAQGQNDWYKRLRCILNPRELASLWHVPYEAFTAPGIWWVTGKQTPLPIELKTNRRDICLGDNRYVGQEHPVYLPNDNREGHMIVFGKTGVGKSTLLHNLIHQDIAAGSGVAVIDPHGRLVRDILRTSIPPAREQDVVVWDLSNRAYPPPLNILQVSERYERSEAVTQVLNIFERLYPDFGSTRMAYTLSLALSTLVVDDTPTLLDVGRLFRDEKYRWDLLEKLEDADTQDAWDGFEQFTPKEQTQRVEPVLQKLRPFTLNSILKPILCHPENLDIFSLMESNKIILISLEAQKGIQLPQFSERLLGAVLVSQLQMAAKVGAVSERFYVYIDEAENFVTTAVSEVLSQARKQNLSLILANQFLKQLTGDILNAVIGNIGAMIAFQMGDPDARAISASMRPNFTVDDLVQLDKYQAAVFMRFGTQQLPAFSINTRPAPLLKDLAVGLETEARIRNLSIQQHTPKTREEIIAWLNTRYPPRKRPGRGTDDVSFWEPLE